MLAVNYRTQVDYNTSSIEYRYLKTIDRYRGLNAENIKLIEHHGLVVIINSGLDGNDRVAVYRFKNYTDEFIDDITKEIELNQKYMRIRFIN